MTAAAAAAVSTLDAAVAESVGAATEAAAAGSDDDTATAALVAAAGTPTAGHSAVGIGLFAALHASGYVHPLTGVTIAAVSALSAHPSPTLAVTEPVNEGGGSVTAPRVAVYVGRSDTDPTGTPAMDVGGNVPNCALAVAAIVPAPAPPVCHDWNWPSNCSPTTPSFAHMPEAFRGSVGIQPFSSPSW